MKSTTKVLIGAGLIMALTVGGFFVALARAADAPKVAPKFEATEQFVAEKLDAAAMFSEEQRGKILALIREQLPALKKVMARLAEGQNLLKEMIADPDVDEKAIRAEAAKLTDALVDYSKQRTQLVSGLKGLLTPEQLNRQDGQASLAKFVEGIAKVLAKE